MRTLGLGQGLKPVGDLREALGACRLRHAWVHIGILVGLTGDGCLQIIGGAADRQVGGGITYRLQILEMAVGMARFPFGGGAEDRGDVIEALYIGLGGEIEVTAVGLGLTGESGLEIVVGLVPFRFILYTPCLGLT